MPNVAFGLGRHSDKTFFRERVLDMPHEVGSEFNLTRDFCERRLFTTFPRICVVYREQWSC